MIANNGKAQEKLAVVNKNDMKVYFPVDVYECDGRVIIEVED